MTRTLDDWLICLLAQPAIPPAPVFRVVPPAADPAVLIGALAGLVAEALARGRTLWIVTGDDRLLPDISNALDLRLRPLCLVLPGAEPASQIALRATLSLLKSRLARIPAETDDAAWAAMRAGIERADVLWRASLAWLTRDLEREAPPTGICNLFPVRIGPWPVAQRHAQPTDWVVLIQSGQLPAQLCVAWPGARHTLMLSAPTRGATGIAPIDETARLRAELELLGQELAELELELATAQGELAAFGARYHRLIAQRMMELDRLQAEMAESRLRIAPGGEALAQAAAARARAEQSRHEYHRRQATGSGAPAFAPPDDLKKRFRQLAQKIHPDRASDEADRAWRTQLMSEANRAYRAGDAAALEELFALWLEGQHRIPADVVPAAPASAISHALAAQRAAIKRRIAAIAAELDRLYGSQLYELLTADRMAKRQGRDLLAEMAARLDEQIALVQAELDSLG